MFVVESRSRRGPPEELIHKFHVYARRGLFAVLLLQGSIYRAETWNVAVSSVVMPFKNTDMNVLIQNVCNVIAYELLKVQPCSNIPRGVQHYDLYAF